MREFNALYDFSNLQTVAIGVTSTRSTAISFEEVLVHATSACFIRVGDSAVTVSSTTGIPLNAGEKLSIKIPRGAFIAVIQSSTAGTLVITPILR